MNDRSQVIESRIDRNVAAAVAISSGSGGAMTIVPRTMGELFELSKLMAVSGDCIRPAFRNNPGACLALAMQAYRWGADPFALANKAYITRNKAGETQIAFEAGAISAIVNTSNVLQKRLRFEYSGEKTERRCRVLGWVKGEDEPLEYTSPTIAQIAVKNSPLWQGDPDQQLAYFSARAWARRHVPEVLLGISVAGEEGEIIDVTADRIDEHAASVQQQEPPQQPEPWTVYDPMGEAYEFDRADSAAEACRRILIAAAADPKALATAWDNNSGLLDDLTAEGHDDAVTALRTLYAALAPQPTTTGGETSGAVTNDAPGPASAPEGSASEPAQEVQDTPPLPETEPEPPRPAPNIPASPPAANRQQSAEKHDAFWDRNSLKLDPMPVRGSGNLNNLDWKSWPLLIKPRLAEIWSVPLLNAFYQANAENLDKYATARGEREREELMAAFDDVRMRVAQP